MEESCQTLDPKTKSLNPSFQTNEIPKSLQQTTGPEALANK